MDDWETGQPPNEEIVEVLDDDGTVLEAAAFYGRDGYLPHWQSADGNTRWDPERFTKWRRIER
jgi:hypothetical protein